MKEGKILLKCKKGGCPRQKFVDRTEYDPLNAAYALLYCPWHIQEGDGEEYYDRNGVVIPIN